MKVAGRPGPTTFEYIERHALFDPKRPALMQDNQSWTYEEVCADLVRVIRLLHAMGVRRGQRVAVGTLAFQTSMLLLLAAESLGAVTTFFLATGDPDLEPLFRIVDWVFSDRAQAVPANARFVCVDEEFVQRFQAIQAGERNALPVVAPDLHEPQRITRTSGSSGLSKFMVLSRNAQEYWVTSAISELVLRADSRLLIVGPLVMNGMYSRASACLRVGGVTMAFAQTSPAAHGVTHIASLPIHLQALLDSLPAGYTAARPADVFVVGGAVSPRMRRRITGAFAGRIVNRYGMNEAGAICDDLDAEGVGAVSPGVDIRILDAQGKDAAPGEAGIIAVRTPAMVEEYVDDPQATAAAFAGGWFMSGDWGALVAPRMLRLAGRHDEMVNIGGLKYAAREIERQLRELVQPLDCAVLATNLQGGRATVGVALVVDEGAAREDVTARIAEFLQGAAFVVFLQAIPVLPSGKVDRVALHRDFAARSTQGAR